MSRAWQAAIGNTDAHLGNCALAAADELSSEFQARWLRYVGALR